MNALIDAALEIAERWPVFPCGADKSPACPHGFKDATQDPETIHNLFSAPGVALIGVPTGRLSGLFIVDGDVKNGTDGTAWMRERGLCATRLHKTRSGGLHAVYQHPTSVVDLGCSVSKLAPGVDTRGSGGYVIWWPAAGEPILCDDDPVDLPSWVAEELAPRCQRQVAGTDRPEIIPEGRRNDTLTSLAGTMGAKGMSPAAIRAALHHENTARCRPPLDPAEVDRIADSAAAWPEGKQKLEITEDSLALEFSDAYGTDFRYCAIWGKWMLWQGHVWRPDTTVAVYDKTRTLMRPYIARTGNKTFGKAATVAGVEKLARCDRRHAVEPEQFDADPWLLNTPAGVVDLRTGTMRPPQREAYATKSTAVAPDFDARCELWDRFVGRTFNEDEDLIQYVRKVFGYCLTGSVRENKLWFCYGTGRNGKGVFTDTMAASMGDYAQTSPMSVFMATRDDRHPTELAMLRGARLVTASETQSGGRWNEERIKTLTGGDRISARFMRQDFFEFSPTHKLILAGNHKPRLRSVDEAIRRRLVLVPFTVTIPASEVDPDLREKLRAERPAILAWAIGGCVDYLQEGLAPPVAVAEATDSYLAAEDGVGQWLEDRTERSTNGGTSGKRLWDDWKAWAEANREPAGRKQDLFDALEARGHRKSKLNSGPDRKSHGFETLSLRPAP